MMLASCEDELLEERLSDGKLRTELACNWLLWDCIWLALLLDRHCWEKLLLWEFLLGDDWFDEELELGNATEVRKSGGPGWFPIIPPFKLLPPLDWLCFPLPRETCCCGCWKFAREFWRFSSFKDWGECWGACNWLLLEKAIDVDNNWDEFDILLLLMKLSIWLGLKMTEGKLCCLTPEISDGETRLGCVDVTTWWWDWRSKSINCWCCCGVFKPRRATINSR